MAIHPEAQAFFNLEPHQVLTAIDNAGFTTTGEILQLNSYENRVFEIGLEANSHPEGFKKIITKFYRPKRWSKAAIFEEHQFLSDLKSEGIPAVAPLVLNNQETLSEHQGLYMACFPKIYGRMPQEFLPTDLHQVGRRLAQIHNVGARKKATHRPTIGTSYYGGWQTLDILSNHVGPEVWNRYEEAASHILNIIDDEFDEKDFFRIHGDCHKGNLLSDGSQFFYVDFDDFCNGPAVQDFWMLMSDEISSAEEREKILSGYEELRSFNWKEWEWVPLLRALRIIGYAGWIAQRWSDPSFPRLFPEFGTYKYWAEEVEALERIAWSL